MRPKLGPGVSLAFVIFERLTAIFRSIWFYFHLCTRGARRNRVAFNPV